MGDRIKKLWLAGLIVCALGTLAATPALGSHSWGSYHWPKASTSASTVSVTLGSNLTVSRSTNWPALFSGSASAPLGSPGTVVHDWTNLNLMPLGVGNSFSDILDTPWTTGANTTSQKRCKPLSGRVEVCNARYGYNGWLGLAQIWISGGHIVQGTAKMNDSYLDSSRYTTVAKQQVLCQEVGHTFGLDHPDESGKDLDTCMDYADAFDNAHPNAHDNEQINAIYSSHTDAGGSATATSSKGQGQVRRVEEDLYVEELPGGGRVLTFVTWKNHQAAAAAPDDRVPE